jgi:hypothetical protein
LIFLSEGVLLGLAAQHRGGLAVEAKIPHSRRNSVLSGEAGLL